jgi:hypothetical protein
MENSLILSKAVIGKQEVDKGRPVQGRDVLGCPDILVGEIVGPRSIIYLNGMNKRFAGCCILLRHRPPLKV